MAIQKIKPSPRNADSTAVATPSRTGSFGEAYSIPMGLGRVSVADEGSYWTGVNPTLGTAIVGHVAPAIADTNTKSILHIFNGGTADVYMDYIWLKQTVVNASSTASDYLAWIDNKGVTGKTSGGTVITEANCRSNSTVATGCVSTFGAVITAPSASAVKVFQRTVRPVISVAEDQYIFDFGGNIHLPSAQAITGTSVAAVIVSAPPIVIGPGGNFYFVQTGPSGATTASTFEFEWGRWER